jgi:hypothetical protein
MHLSACAACQTDLLLVLQDCALILALCHVILVSSILCKTNVTYLYSSSSQSFPVKQSEAQANMHARAQLSFSNDLASFDLRSDREEEAVEKPRPDKPDVRVLI